LTIRHLGIEPMDEGLQRLSGRRRTALPRHVLGDVQDDQLSAETLCETTSIDKRRRPRGVEVDGDEDPVNASHVLVSWPHLHRCITGCASKRYTRWAAMSGAARVSDFADTSSTDASGRTVRCFVTATSAPAPTVNITPSKTWLPAAAATMRR
jgi:hypothetical protein